MTTRKNPAGSGAISDAYSDDDTSKCNHPCPVCTVDAEVDRLTRERLVADEIVASLRRHMAILPVDDFRRDWFAGAIAGINEVTA